MDEVLKGQLNIRYFKAVFTVCFPNGGDLPENKTSALRGGMGEMLLQMHCISDRNCDTCSFAEECTVQRTMYSQMAIVPPFMGSHDSVGYVIECGDKQIHYAAGGELTFCLLLFGKTIVHFKSFLRAFIMLGKTGLGIEKTHFQVESVKNSFGKTVFDGKRLHTNNISVHTVYEYVEHRLEQSTGQLDSEYEIRFLSPVSIKKDREELKNLQIDAVLWSARRRLYVLNCFEGKDIPYDSAEIFSIPKILKQESFPASIKRFSNRSGTVMRLKGLEGCIRFQSISEELLGLLYAGELVHIGKSTSFGFGDYQVITIIRQEVSES